MQDPDKCHLTGADGDAADTIKPTIVSQITALRHKQDELFAEAKERRLDVIAELAGLCQLLGPLTRDELPDGVLKRRRPKKSTRKASAPRKPKTDEAPRP